MCQQCEEHKQTIATLRSQLQQLRNMMFMKQETINNTPPR
jgi:hypothetical protein